jgi:hypothetical protein
VKRLDVACGQIGSVGWEQALSESCAMPRLGWTEPSFMALTAGADVCRNRTDSRAAHLPGYSVITFVASDSNSIRRRRRLGQYHRPISNKRETRTSGRYQADVVTA